MNVIAITNSLPRAKLSGATHIVDSYAEIDQLLLAQDGHRVGAGDAGADLGSQH